MQRTKINDSYSSWIEILSGVLQGSILESILINDVNFASYADDNAIYDSGDSIDTVITSFRQKTFQWFSENQMKGNNDKHHFIISTKKTYQIFVDNSSVGSGKCGKLLKVKIDSKLTFDDHVKDIC